MHSLHTRWVGRGVYSKRDHIVTPRDPFEGKLSLAPQGGEAEKVNMSRISFRVLFLLLVLILLLASFLFGVLTYWLDAGSPPSSGPMDGGRLRMQPRYVAEVLVPGSRALSGQVRELSPCNPFVQRAKGFLIEVGG
jgi:hypothetical protein